MSTDPVLLAFAAHAEQVMGLMEAGAMDRHAALAALVSDALAASQAEGVDPETADALLDMACTWSLVRLRGLTGDVLLLDSPVPDDAADLDTGEGA